VFIDLINYYIIAEHNGMSPIKVSNFEPNVKFRHLKWRHSGLKCNWRSASSGTSWVPSCSYAKLPISITWIYFMPGRQIKRCNL